MKERRPFSRLTLLLALGPISGLLAEEALANARSGNHVAAYLYTATIPCALFLLIELARMPWS